MPRIKCHYIDCVFLDEGYCSAAAVEFDPDAGCNTYSVADGLAKKDEDWDEEEESEEWEEEDGDEDDDDGWLDEEDEL
jgi:hypothetical protein